MIVRDDVVGGTMRTATVGNDVSEALALKGLIAAADPAARIARYMINGQGRAALRHLMAADENRAQGRHGGTAAYPEDALDGGKLERYLVTDTPLLALVRRKDSDGKPFLVGAPIRAGERLREDFELADFGKF